MADDQIFRLILILGFAVVFPIGLYHRLKSQTSREKLNRREEGLFILLTLRPVAIVRMVGVIAYVINPAWMAWSAFGLPIWLRWLGVGMGVIAAVLLIVVFRTLGTNITDTVVTRAHHSLVTSGPYRWVRHPFYVATALAVTADSMVTANWFLAVTGSVVVALIAIRTRTEEQKLIERFGDEYRIYMQRTGRFIPRGARLSR
jgi:protein-S-isoprenylcysteine O-methyltransferase Ste14